MLVTGTELKQGDLVFMLNERGRVKTLTFVCFDHTRSIPIFRDESNNYASFHKHNIEDGCLSKDQNFVIEEKIKRSLKRIEQLREDIHNDSKRLFDFRKNNKELESKDLDS